MSDAPMVGRPSAPPPRRRAPVRTIIGIVIVILLAVGVAFLLSRCAAGGQSGQGGPGGRGPGGPPPAEIARIYPLVEQNATDHRQKVRAAAKQKQVADREALFSKLKQNTRAAASALASA